MTCQAPFHTNETVDKNHKGKEFRTIIRILCFIKTYGQKLMSSYIITLQRTFLLSTLHQPNVVRDKTQFKYF